MRISSVSMDMGSLRCSLHLFPQPRGWWGGHVILDGPATSLISDVIHDYRSWSSSPFSVGVAMPF